MFDFMRKKKDVLPEGHAQTVNKSKRSRRTSIMLPVGRAGSSKKRERPMSSSLTSDASSQEDALTRPSYARAGSSSSRASFDFRNPFLDDGDTYHTSTSQLDLTESLDSAAFQPPMVNTSIGNVARGSPRIVHPPGDYAELFYHVVAEVDGSAVPLVDETGINERQEMPETTVTENVLPDNQRRCSTAARRKAADLHGSIPVSGFAPPVGVGRREAWTSV
ncbi:hypothetical protein C8Q72DRAFT_879307 [Fomitopsis betulina]|nr:hypothetical protein C8Q72DRAFT_879307 [Fomitopsis betulina]